MDELLPNTELSHYRIISKIGSGGMGEVYLAEDTKLDRRVALKFLSAVHATDDDKLKRFTQEAKAASALNHQNILTIYEIGSVDEQQYIATEYIKGQTLRDRMASSQPLELREALGITTQVAAALAAAHEAGIIHRDIKPENIMIRADGLVKVLDFGLAKLSASLSAASVNVTLPQLNTEPGMLMGTIAYMSPEQARGQNLDPRSDIFSLGITMFELFTGDRPFAGDGHLDLISSILKDDPPSLREIAPQLPRQLERIVDKALRKDLGNRYQHIKDLQIDVEDLREELKLDSTSNARVEKTMISPTPAPTGDMRRNLTGSISTTRRFTILHAIMFAVAVAAVVGSAWYFRVGFGSPPPAPGSYKTAEVATWTSAAGELFSNARFSPDGKMIAFSSTKSGTKNIWLTQTGSTEAIQITNDGFSNIDPVWSHKGDEIAYLSIRASSQTGGSTFGIWRVSALGGGVPRMIAPIADGTAELRLWGRTGLIYYQVKQDLIAVSTANGAAQKVMSLNTGVSSKAEVAPDERSVAYASQENDKWRILIRKMGEEEDVEVAAGTGHVDGIAWGQAKNRLFYSATQDGVSQVFMTTIGSGGSSQITRSETDINVVDAAFDGRSILMSSAKEESNLWRVGVNDRQEMPVSRDLNAKLWPAVSPDGTQIVFQSVKNLSQGNNLTNNSIVVKTVKQRDDSERPIVLTDNGHLPTWSPDGQLVVFLRQADGSRNLFTISPNGGGERQLTTNGVREMGYSVSPYNTISRNHYAWSPDGSWIAYSSERYGVYNIWLVNVRSGSASQLSINTDVTITVSSPSWSGDGKFVAIAVEKRDLSTTNNTRGVLVIDTSTRNTATAYESTKSHRLIGWTPENDALIIAEPSRPLSSLPPETTLKRISLRGAAESALATLKNVYFYNIFLSDDRKSIAFAARNDNRDDIWVLSTAGGAPRRITANNDSGLYFSRLAWFHDGSAITFGKQTRFSLLSIVTGIE
ncbi:MAG: protein kinase [Pyrinomonadaceae bacterium]